MKKYFFIMFMCFCDLFVIFSQQVTKQEAINAAINTMKYNGISNVSKSNISNVYTKQNGDTTLMYEVIFQTGEVVLLSGNKACLPILGYNIPDNYNNNSQKAIFSQSILNNYDNIPEGLKDMLEEYIEQIVYCFRNSINMGYSNEWNELQFFQSNRTTRSVIVEPLLTSIWGQSISNDNWDCYAYNYYITATHDSCTCGIQKKCPVGCVATAIAQIMNYWKYPVWRADKTYQYDWCNMPDYLNSFNSNYIQERNAIAKLMKDCGEAVDMDYCGSNKCSSGAYDQNVPDALKEFGYNDINLKQKFWHQTNWITLLQSDLNNCWPIYYSGSGNDGGHAFVCDGYDNNNLFHFNWGWNGQYNMWCTVSQLNPYIYSFTSSQAAIFNIYPSGTQNYCNFDLPLWVHYYEYYIVYGNTTPAPYQNVPKTFTRLTSVPSSLSQYPSSWRTIPSGATAEYVAHEEILLGDGFEAQQGSVFDAYIIPCYACEINRENTIVSKQIEDIKENYPNLQRKVVDSFISKEKLTNKSMHIYPNPTNGTFYIKLANVDESIKQVYVNNILGKEMLRKNNLHNNEAIDISALPAGLYVVRVLTLNGKTYYGKLVKE